MADAADDDDGKMPAEPEKEGSSRGFPQSRVPFSKVLETMIGLGEQYNRKKNKKFANELLVAAANFLEDQVFDKHDNCWFEGTLFGMLAEAFPGKLNHIIETFSDNKIYQLFEKGFVGRVYEAAYIDGDGSIYGNRGEEDTVDCFVCNISVSNHAPYHYLLTSTGGYNKGLNRAMNGEFFVDAITISAFNCALVLKRPQFLSVLAVSSSARTGLEGGVSKNTPLAKATSASLSRILSALNSNHGIGFSVDYYENLFRQILGFERKHTDMNNPAPILFLVYLAGIIGSDGGVGRNFGREITIYQSNRNYLLGLQRVSKEVFGLDDEECYVTRNSQTLSSNHRKKFILVFKGNAMKRILPFIALFDYNRRTQHLLLLILHLVKDCDESQFSNKENVVTFLLHLLIIIRIYYPSKRKIIVITITALVELVTQTLSCFQ